MELTADGAESDLAQTDLGAAETGSDLKQTDLSTAKAESNLKQTDLGAAGQPCCTSLGGGVKNDFETGGGQIRCTSLWNLESLGSLGGHVENDFETGGCVMAELMALDPERL
jgi:hypothetical protein